MEERVPYRRTFARLLGFLRPYKLSLVVSILLAVGSQRRSSPSTRSPAG